MARLWIIGPLALAFVLGIAVGGIYEKARAARAGVGGTATREAATIGGFLPASHTTVPPRIYAERASLVYDDQRGGEPCYLAVSMEDRGFISATVDERICRQYGLDSQPRR